MRSTPTIGTRAASASRTTPSHAPEAHQHSAAHLMSGVQRAGERLQRAVQALSDPDEPLGRLQAVAARAQSNAASGTDEIHSSLAHGVLAETAALREALLGLAQLEQLETGAFQLQPQPVELGDLLMEIVPRWQARAGRHSFELALPGEVPMIVADAALLEKAIDALLDYSVRLGPAGSTVRVDIRPGVDEVVVIVRQFSAPLPAELLPRVFEPFFRHGDIALAPLGGVGLALARAIVAAHGGRVWAENLPEGPGTALHAALLHLPNPPLLDPFTVETPATPPEAGGRVTAPRSRQVVLVTERDPRMQRYIRANLEARGYRVLLTSELDGAQHMIDLEEPDAILLDPSVDSSPMVDVVSRMRAYSSGPVIVLARRHDPTECAHALDSGASDYIVKPFSIDELVARLRAALRAQHAMSRPMSHETVVSLGGLVIDIERRSVTLDSRPVALSKTEFKLLRALARHVGVVVSHDELLERVWGPDCVQESAFLWVYVRRLRRKIEPDPSNPVFIRTVPGVGYRLAAPE